MSDIVERLRRRISMTRPDVKMYIDPAVETEAVEEIERLRAEVKALRKAAGPHRPLSEGVTLETVTVRATKKVEP